ncbi:MAG TPA: hypothetical protein VF504_01155, partial [Solirubrobacterales bacterium]
FVATALEPGRQGPSTTLFRFRPDGTRDRSFGRNGVVRAKARAPLVGFFVSRRLTLVSGVGRWGENGVAIRVFKRDGSLARGFGRGGLVVAERSKRRHFRPVGAARQDERIVVAGSTGMLEEAGARIELLRFR